MNLIAEYSIGPVMLRYFQNPAGGCEWIILPTEKSSEVLLPKREKFDSLVQVKLAEDDFPKGFVTGTSMRNSGTTKSLRFVKQEQQETNQQLTIITLLTDKHHNKYQHHAIIDKQTAVVETFVVFQNTSAQQQKLQLLTTFSLSNLSPFFNENPAGNLWLTRYRSKWSFEGRKEKRPIEEFQLEPSWKPSGAGLLKFGQIGSMPIRGFFSTLFVEDQSNHVTWGVKLAHPGSWQMEAYRIDEDLCLAGGLADADYGQWTKDLQIGESFTTPSAYLTAVVGDEEVCGNRFNRFQAHSIIAHEHASELSLATMFNEFCTTWGAPSETSINQSLAVLKERQLDYYVIDAGWYADEAKGWEKNMGDWEINSKQFPNGLQPVIQAIREAGMVPGIWFEIETVGRDATAFKLVDHLLKRDGMPITTGDRRFWDMNDPWVIDYLTKKVIGFLKEYQIGYLKIDYNDSFGVGFDHQESFGEANRQHLLGTQRFFRQVQQTLPDLIIENCSSGGHRLEPSMQAITDLSSFSDAHEAVSIPIIAANLHELMPPQQSLIWAVLRDEDSIQRIHYSMTATFLGRLCLSGDIHELKAEQWQAVDEGLIFYQKIKHIIKAGNSHRFGKPVLSYRQPIGEQALLRYSLAGDEALIIIHSFESPAEIKIPLTGTFELVDSYGADCSIKFENNHLTCQLAVAFQGSALYLRRIKIRGEIK